MCVLCVVTVVCCFVSIVCVCFVCIVRFVCWCELRFEIKNKATCFPPTRMLCFDNRHLHLIVEGCPGDPIELPF